MNKLKELRLIVKMNERLGVETEQSVFDQILKEEQKEQKQLALQEERKAVFKSTFADLSGQISKLMAEEKQKSAEEQALLDRFANVLAKIDDIKVNVVADEPQVTISEDAEEGQQVEDILEGIVEIPEPEVIEEKAAILAPIEEPSLAKEAAKKIKKKDQPPSMFVQPAPEVTGRDLKDIQQKLKLLEGWVGKISMTGPGGGAVWLRDLDDVARSSVLGATDGQVLTYNESIKKWTAQDPTGGGPDGYVLPTASTTTKGGVKIDGTTITISNQVISANTAVDWLHVPSSIIPNTTLSYSLGNNTMRWESMWVGGNSITFTDQTAGFPDQKLTLANGVFYIAIANTTQQSNAGLRVGNFLLQNNYIQLTNTEATFYIGSTLGTGNLVINRPVVMNSPDTGKTTFTVSRSGRVQIFVPTIPAGDVGGLSIIGSADGSYRGVVNPGGMLHITGNDGVVSRITNDAFGANVFPAYVSRAGRGTANTPTAIQSGDTLSRYSTVGWGTTNYAGGSIPAATNIEVVAKENFTDTAGGTEYRIYTAPIGTTTKTLALCIDDIGITANNANLTYITANGSVGTNTQVLASNGTGIYWTNATAGATGANGANGISVTAANVNSNGYLIITYSNTATANAGYVVGPAGANGSNVSQIQTDWNQSNTSAIDFIKNKPTIPTTIDSLTDVTITGPLNNQVLTYNTGLGQWINQNGTSNNFTTGYFGAFYYNGANVALSNTTNAYVVPITASYDGTNGVTIGSNNNLIFAHSGTYHIEYSIQYENAGNSDDDVSVWVRLNEANLADTNSLFTVNRKNTGAEPGSLIAVTPFMVTVTSGDRVQFMTASARGQTKIVSYAAGTTPTIPGTPAVIVNVEQVSGIVIPDNISGTANNALYLGGFAANQYAYANLTISRLTGSQLVGDVALYSNGTMSFPLDRIETGNKSAALWSSNQATLIWRGAGGAGQPLQTVVQSMPGYVNLGTATGILGGATITHDWKFDTAGVMTFPDNTTQNTAWTGSVATLTSNNSTYLGGIAANQYAYANALSSYQTTTGLSANVATLSSNNASYLGTVAANQYAYANGSNIGTLPSLRVTGSVNFGSNSFAKTTSTGDVTLDNGTTDTPGMLMYYANNLNWGVDSYNGTFSVLSGQMFRVVNNLNESGGSMKMAIDTTGNMAVTGFVQPGAYRAGQVIKDIMLSNTEFSVLATTVATSTSDTDFISYSYTPVSSSSYLIIHVHVAAYDALTGTGGGSDSYFSRIKVEGNEITYGRQATVASNSFRTGTLFPLTGRYTNSNTSAKAITVGVRRDSADDSITIVNSATALWMRITEIAR